MESLLNGWKMPVDQGAYVVRRHVACFDQEQLPRTALQDMRVKEVRILGHHDSLLTNGNLTDDRILGLVASRKIQRVRCIMSVLNEKATESAWQMGIDEESHVKAR